MFALIDKYPKVVPPFLAAVVLAFIVAILFGYVLP